MACFRHLTVRSKGLGRRMILIMPVCHITSSSKLCGETGTAGTGRNHLQRLRVRSRKEIWLKTRLYKWLCSFVAADENSVMNSNRWFLYWWSARSSRWYEGSAEFGNWMCLPVGGD